MNFTNMYSENSLCPICERRPDTQEHLSLCPVLQSILPLVKHIDYSHIHGSVEPQVNIRPPLGLSRRVALSGISNVEEYGLLKF